MAHDITAARQYDAYGQLVGASGTWAGPFGYGGGFGYQTDETGLQLLGHCYYDSSTGRFLTRDPIKDGRNWYVYCENNPINGADPTGLQVGHPGFGERLSFASSSPDRKEFRLGHGPKGGRNAVNYVDSSRTQSFYRRMAPSLANW